jgi:hypothetical protein
LGPQCRSHTPGSSVYDQLIFHWDFVKTLYRLIMVDIGEQNKTGPTGISTNILFLYFSSCSICRMIFWGCKQQFDSLVIGRIVSVQRREVFLEMVPTSLGSESRLQNSWDFSTSFVLFTVCWYKFSLLCSMPFWKISKAESEQLEKVVTEGFYFSYDIFENIMTTRPRTPPETSAYTNVAVSSRMYYHKWSLLL